MERNTSVATEAIVRMATCRIGRTSEGVQGIPGRVYDQHNRQYSKQLLS